MYSYNEDCNSRFDIDELEYREDEESIEDEIDSDIEAALYSQIHHQENPSYELTKEETENCCAEDDLVHKNSNREQSSSDTLNEDKAMASVITISDESDNCVISDTQSSDIIFVSEVKNKINNDDNGCILLKNNPQNNQKKWWAEFVSATYNENDVEDVLVDDRNLNQNENKCTTKLRSAVDVESGSSTLPCKGNKVKCLSLPARNNSTLRSRKRKQNRSTSSKDNAFKHSKCKKEDKDIIINVKTPAVTIDLTNDDDLWKICSRDEYQCKTESKRYYNKQTRIICKNCSERGHISRDCPSPRKLPICYLCGKAGHEALNCLNPACTRCFAVGHSAKCCKWSDTSIEQCPICNMWNHLREECPDVWRRYHMTTSPGPLICGSASRSETVFCYNCAREGHFGHECNVGRMNPYSFPTSPFISQYSDPLSELAGYGTLGKIKINEYFQRMAKKKRKHIKQANRRFEKDKKYLEKKAERILNSSLSPAKQKKTNPSFTSSQETPNVSESTKICCISQKTKKKKKKKKNENTSILPNPINQQTKKTRKHKMKKLKKTQNAVAKHKPMFGNRDEAINVNSGKTVAGFLKRLVPELHFSMRCMQLFANEASVNL